MLAVLKHELRNYFNTLTAYVFGAFLLLFIGLGAMMYNLEAAVSNFEYVLSFGCLIFVVIVPIITMKTIAEERRRKTDQLLYSLPLTTTDIVVGKYFALLAVFCLPMCIVAIYPLIFRQYGDVYLPVSYGSIVAFIVMGSALLAIGMFISSLTENQGLAAGIGVAVMLFNYYSVSLAEYASGSGMGTMIAFIVMIFAVGLLVYFITGSDMPAYCICILLMLVTIAFRLFAPGIFENFIPQAMKTVSLFEHFYTFVNGVFDLTAIVYFVTVIVFFLFLTVQSLEKRRYN